MISWENPEDRVAIVQMNADLRHAQLELLSAQCATHQLRLRFSTEDIARFAEQEVLRKAIESATGLKAFYTSVAKHLQESAAAHNSHTAAQLQPERAAQAASLLHSYLNQQRDVYARFGVGLDAQSKTMMRPFFSAGILDHVLAIELNGRNLENPPFYADAQAMGLAHLPEISSMPSVTFIDVFVFNPTLNPRQLFHALTHAVQFQVLGAERYAEFFVRGFFRTGSHHTVPLEAHAFQLESRFMKNRGDSFSVEEQVRLWARESRY